MPRIKVQNLKISGNPGLAARFRSLREIQAAYEDQKSSPFGIHWLENLSTEVDTLEELSELLTFLKTCDEVHFHGDTVIQITRNPGTENKIINIKDERLTVDAIIDSLHHWDRASARGIAGAAGSGAAGAAEPYEPETDAASGAGGGFSSSAPEATRGLSSEAKEKLRKFFSSGGFELSSVRQEYFLNFFVNENCRTPDTFFDLWDTVKATRSSLGDDTTLPSILLRVMREVVSIGFVLSLRNLTGVTPEEIWELINRYDTTCDETLTGFLGACYRAISPTMTLADAWLMNSELSRPFAEKMNQIWERPPEPLNILAHAHPLPPSLVSKLDTDRNPLSELNTREVRAIRTAYAIALRCKTKPAVDLLPMMREKPFMLKALGTLKEKCPPAFDEIMEEASKDRTNPLLNFFQHTSGIFYGIRPVSATNPDLLAFQRLAREAPGSGARFAGILTPGTDEDRPVPPGDLSLN